MRILLAANASYVPPRGGATRSNLAWLTRLAAGGHDCRIVSAALTGESQTLQHGAVTVYTVAERARLAPVLREQIREFRPDWVLISSEDVGHLLLREAHDAALGRIVYLAHTPQFFPFGPESWNPDPRATALLAQAAGIVAIGQHTAGYIRRHLGREATVIHPPIYGGEHPNLARFDGGLIAMLNPCAIKGISIFLDLAGRFPAYRFGCMPGWGTTASDRARLAAHGNVTILPNYPDIADFLRQTSILLMPSLWYEGFGLTVMEAMLHGIPVIASDAGGLVEAKSGTPFIAPVHAIERYEPVFDEHALPRPVVEPTDLKPWQDALHTLLTDRTVYERVSVQSREAAQRFVAALNPDGLAEYLQSLVPPAGASRPLRLLLAQNSNYYPAHGGGDKSNRLLMEALAARGHTCRVIARISRFGPAEHDRYLKELSARGVSPESAADGVVTFKYQSVEAHVITQHPNLRAYFAAQIAEFAPDIVITSTDDPAQVLLEAALRANVRTVYLARATLALPFGPDCAFPSAAKTEMLRQTEAVVGVSRYVAEYIRKWGGAPAVHVPISLLDPPPYPDLGGFENEFVSLVNPCAVKGISIFLELANRMPGVRFAAVPTWGTTASDRAALAGLPNITLLDPVDNVDEILRRTRVLLVPSLWAEARSRIVVEAMLRGIPVIAGNIGGIPEAMLGVDYLLPVRPIVAYRQQVDEQMVPIAEVPPQDISPWQAALERLLSDRAHYVALARASRQAALGYASDLTIAPFEALLKDIARLPAKAHATSPANHRPALDKLSPERRQLLAARLRKMSHPPPGTLRLFCFPHAGGGGSLYQRWRGRLPDGFVVVPMRPPGRATMTETVAAQAEIIEPHLDAPFALFGHSMGAAVAFEVTRLLRRENRPLPRMLIVSGARAPQFRRHHVPGPEPTDEQFVAELRRLQGTPREVLDDPTLLRLILPGLRDDAAVYRSYIYRDEPPLDIPIRAYGGNADPNVAHHHLQAWSEQTTVSFRATFIPGGHFFLETARDEFLSSLANDLAECAIHPAGTISL